MPFFIILKALSNNLIKKKKKDYVIYTLKDISQNLIHKTKKNYYMPTQLQLIAWSPQNQGPYQHWTKEKQKTFEGLAFVHPWPFL